MYTLYYSPGTASLCVYQALIESAAADLLLIMLMRWSRNMPGPATEWPALRQFAARMKDRPSWKQLYALEGLNDWT
jgi:glutathione S-transferase